MAVASSPRRRCRSGGEFRVCVPGSSASGPFAFTSALAGHCSSLSPSFTTFCRSATPVASAALEATHGRRHARSVQRLPSHTVSRRILQRSAVHEEYFRHDRGPSQSSAVVVVCAVVAVADLDRSHRMRWVELLAFESRFATLVFFKSHSLRRLRAGIAL